MSTSAAETTSRPSELQRYLSFFSSAARAVRLVWDTDRRLLVAMALLTVLAGILPAAMAVVGQRIVDAVLFAQQAGTGTDITLFLKSDAKEYLDEVRISHLIKKYSDHISFPINWLSKDADPKRLNASTALWTQPAPVSRLEIHPTWHVSPHTLDTGSTARLVLTIG